MESMGKYVLTVITAALLFEIMRPLLGEKTPPAALVKMIGGIFLTFTVISPIKDIRLDEILDIPYNFAAQGTIAAAQGNQISQTNLQSIIKQQSEAYILDKALACQAVLDVEVTLTQEDPPVPSAVRLEGAISPYAKRILQQWLSDEMGISKENQLWID